MTDWHLCKRMAYALIHAAAIMLEIIGSNVDPFPHRPLE